MARKLQQVADVNLLGVSFQVSLAGRQLIHLLLNRNPVDRLGSNNGANEIKQHPFFRGINWPLIRTMVGLLAFYTLNSQTANDLILTVCLCICRARPR